MGVLTITNGSPMETEVLRSPAVNITVDGNEAAARIAYVLSEVIAIYPITPSSPMGELADQWAAAGRPNLWGTVPRVVEMQSEGGAAGALHGSLQGGALATTFTSSQGLLLMIPNMFKIAGELTPAVIHVAARSLATHALSIFGDHSDVMATRSTGWAMLASNSVQEALDLALIAHAAAHKTRVPFVHFFDGFRTSHEIHKIEDIPQVVIREIFDRGFVRAQRSRALSPDRPFIRGTAQNPDVYFQAREAANPYYLAAPRIVHTLMDEFARLTGRKYHLFDYVGAPDAERVLVLMGSGAETAEETVNFLAEAGEKVGVLKVRLYRPFSVEHFVSALPVTVKKIGVLDRTKEPGSVGESLYLDVVAALDEASRAETDSPHPLEVSDIIGGRFGLSSKEFTPAMVKAVFDELAPGESRRHFTIGIHDDVTHTSLSYDPEFSTEDPETIRAVFYGLGADGTVGANKNSIKIIGEHTDHHAQGYFVYDSKKSGSVTISHLRFGPRPIRSTYLISEANFVACHQFAFLDRLDVLKVAESGATFLLNSPFGPDEVWDRLPANVQEQILTKPLRFFVIDAAAVAREAGLGGRINTVMQVAFFATSHVLPLDDAISAIKDAIAKTYGKRGEEIVRKNFAAVDSALAHLREVTVPRKVTSEIETRPAVPPEAPEFVRNVTARIIAGEGDLLPVSALPPDGTFPTGTAQWEKRNIAPEIPVWDTDLCIQCGKCVIVCPHSAIRSKRVEADLIAIAPTTFKSAPAHWKGKESERYLLQVAPEDCTGCSLCVEVCPAVSKTDKSHRAIDMKPQAPLREQEAENWKFFLNLPETDRRSLSFGVVKDVQLLEPLFEFSGACSGCGETPYVRLVTELFGDRMLIANATGCSSIYGANLPTTPFRANREGRGPAWSNSLFEDNAEFGLGMRLALDKQNQYARELVARMFSEIGEELAQSLLNADQSTEDGIRAQRERVETLKNTLDSLDTLDVEAALRRHDVEDLRSVADALVKKSVWIVGGDGWAYDIGYGGLDHVLASGAKVNILVLDTEVYSNTGGQTSKATPRGAVARFSAGGKPTAKKDLALLAMTYGNVYVARIAMGGSDTQTVKAFLEAEAHPGPSLIIAYAHCIEHGYDMACGIEHQKAAVQSGYWPLFRFNPSLAREGKNPLQLDSRAPTVALTDYLSKETRFAAITKKDGEATRALLEEAEQDVRTRWQMYEKLASGPAEPKPPQKQ
jgi:pyruvate-ferredoxin/flavodoxin oxidoreductase